MIKVGIVGYGNLGNNSIVSKSNLFYARTFINFSQRKISN